MKLTQSVAGMILASGLSSASLSAWELPQGCTLKENGTLLFGNAALTLEAASTGWNFKNNSDWTNVKTKTGEEERSFSGTIIFPDVDEVVNVRLQQTGNGQFRYTGSFHFPEPIGMNGLFSHVRVPFPVEQFVLDGKEVEIPEKLGDSLEIISRRPARTLSVKCWGGMQITVSGDLSLMVQDNRQWGNTMSIRLYVSTPPVAPNTWKDAEVSFDLKLDSPSAEPLTLGTAANRSLSDPDGTGWLGEGPSADLTTLKAGTVALAQFPFDVAENRKAIVTGRGFSQGAVKVDVPAGTRAGAVSLLHAADWPLLDGWQPEKGKPVGYIDVTYADGQTQSIPVRTEIDCSHWRTISLPLPNAVPGFIGEADGMPVGLYASCFALERDNPASFSFRPASPENTAWMIAAVTLSSRAVAFPPVVQRTAYTMKENARWKRLDFSRKTLPGSPLDFSAFYDRHAPAGKYGAVCVNENGEFTFEKAPDKRLRLYGVNFCGTANFQDKKTVDELVDRLVRVGYNTIRIHHHDTLMTDPDAPDSITLNPENMDKLDYFFAKCKEKGLYIATDIYVNRKFRPGDNLGLEDPETLKNVKMLLPVSEAAMENWKEFARRWMTHRNPYTGLTWAEDPALAILGMVNEIFLGTSRGRTPELARLYREKFDAWREEKKITAEDAGTYNLFLADLVDRTYTEMITFLRDELKVKALLTGDCTTSPYTEAGKIWDFVDSHIYFAHPSFPEKQWSLPQRFDTGSSLKRSAIVPGNQMWRRVYGKPLTFTEINFCVPNPYRAESGPLMGAFAARQNWGGLWRFAWSHSRYYLNPSPISTFDACQDPIAQLSDRIVAALYLRGDLPAARPRLTLAKPGALPGEVRALGFQAQIGFPSPDNPLPEDVQVWQSGMEVPDDGCVRYDSGAGTLAVTAERTEVMSLFTGDLEAGLFRVRNADGFMTVAAISKDGKPLAESRDILVLHLTNAFNSGARYDREDLLRAWGEKDRHLVERNTATLELKTDSPWRIAALTADGAEYGEVKAEFKDGILQFMLDPGCYEGGVMAYHLTR